MSALSPVGGKKPTLLRAGLASVRDLRDAFVEPVAPLYVDTVSGSGGDGLSWETAFNLMSTALTNVQTGGHIYFRGDVREECVGSNLKFDVTIEGVGSKHHADVPGTGYHPGATA